MAKIHFSSTFFKEVIQIFRERPLREIIFGKKVSLEGKEKELLSYIKNNPAEFKSNGGRQGSLTKINVTHKAQGEVYLLKNPNQSIKSVLLFDENVKVLPGPDLYVYLSPNNDARQGLGEFLDLGLLKGTKGGQLYYVDKPLSELNKYQSVVIHCKQFDALFSYATLT
jgi:hypothetical protein